MLPSVLGFRVPRCDIPTQHTLQQLRYEQLPDKSPRKTQSGCKVCFQNKQRAREKKETLKTDLEISILASYLSKSPRRTVYGYWK